MGVCLSFWEADSIARMQGIVCEWSLPSKFENCNVDAQDGWRVTLLEFGRILPVFSCRAIDNSRSSTWPYWNFVTECFGNILETMFDWVHRDSLHSFWPFEASGEAHEWIDKFLKKCNKYKIREHTACSMRVAVQITPLQFQNNISC